MLNINTLETLKEKVVGNKKEFDKTKQRSAQAKYHGDKLMIIQRVDLLLEWLPKIHKWEDDIGVALGRLRVQGVDFGIKELASLLPPSEYCVCKEPKLNTDSTACEVCKKAIKEPPAKRESAVL